MKPRTLDTRSFRTKVSMQTLLKHRKTKSMPRLLLGVLVLVLLSVGIAASYALLGTSQDLRQQASGPNCGAITSMVECRDTIGCKIRPYTIRFTCENLNQTECNEEPYHSAYCTLSTTTTSHLCRNWQASGIDHCPETCKGAGTTGVVCPHPNKLDTLFYISTARCTGGYHEIDKGECLSENITCECDHGNSASSSGPATCTRENGVRYPVAARPGCASSPGDTGGGTGGSSVNCRQYDGNKAGCNAVAPVDPNGHSETCGYYNCSNQCHPVGTSNCAAGCSDQCGTGGGGGGTGGGGTGGSGSGTTASPTPNPWGARTVTGKISCAVNNQAVANVPVVAFLGRTITPQYVAGSAKTNTDGQYSINLNIEDSLFTLRLTTNNQDADKAFKRSGNPGITCTDNLAYEVCQYLQIPVGTTKAGFDFTTSAQATNLKAYQADGNNIIFEFRQAKNILNQNIKRYVMRLDHTSDGWYNANSDYYLQVPKVDGKGVGICAADGVCRVSSGDLNAIKAFKMGQYKMGVNPIWDSQVATQPTVELCRAGATVTAAVTNAPPAIPPACGSGYACRAKSAGAPTGSPFLCSTNYQGTYAEWYCCPVKGQVILNGRCATVGTMQKK